MGAIGRESWYLGKLAWGLMAGCAAESWGLEQPGFGNCRASLLSKSAPGSGLLTPKSGRHHALPSLRALPVSVKTDKEPK
jgi:hypothetical protein